MSEYSGPFSRIVEAVARIASKFDVVVKNTGNRLADNLEAIADADIGGGGGSGGSAFYVEFTGDGETSAVTADKTFAETQQALSDNKVVIGYYNECYYYVGNTDFSSEESKNMVFEGPVEVANSGVFHLTILFASEDGADSAQIVSWQYPQSGPA